MRRLLRIKEPSQRTIKPHMHMYTHTHAHPPPTPSLKSCLNILLAFLKDTCSYLEQPPSINCFIPMLGFFTPPTLPLPHFRLSPPPAFCCLSPYTSHIFRPTQRTIYEAWTTLPDYNYHKALLKNLTNESSFNAGRLNARIFTHQH